MSEQVIVGGGPAGAGAAVLLAAAGRRVTLLERDGEPRHRICGEFVSAGAQRRLRSLGLDPAALGGAPIDTMRLVAGRRTASARLPFVAMGLTRRRMDAALLDRAAAAGAAVMRGVSVRALADGGLRTTAGDIRTAAPLLASGKHELRGAPRPKAGCDTGYVGFKTYWRLPPRSRAALAGHIDVILFRGGYAGLQLVEGGIANLCLNVRAARLAALGGGWPALLAALLAEPHLAALLGDAEPLLARPLTIAGVPYGYRHRAVPGETAYRLGDQAAVIPSFCGDGMAIALESAVAAAGAVIAGMPPAAYHHASRARHARQIRIAMLVQRVGASAAAHPLLPMLCARAPALIPALAAMTRVRPAARADDRNAGPEDRDG